jgi:uncharacterized protein
VRILLRNDYVRTPWKNGGGVTEDILLLPEGAGHDDFAIRVSRAPITAEGPFSSFPGIDRHITRLGMQKLTLLFEDHALALERLVPVQFDSVLAPTSRLLDGPTEVLNVMTRRGAWKAEVSVAESGPATLAAPAGGLALAFCAHGAWRVAGGDCVLEAGATLLLEAGESTVLTTENGAAILASIRPA